MLTRLIETYHLRKASDLFLYFYKRKIEISSNITNM